MKKISILLLALLMVCPLQIKADSKWSKENGSWYLYEDNQLVKGWYKENGSWFLLDFSSGMMRSGWVASGKNWYYFNPSNGIMQTGWKTIKNKTYYFETSGKNAGKMLTGRHIIKGVSHDFDENGVYLGESDLTTIIFCGKQVNEGKNTTWIQNFIYFEEDKLTDINSIYTADFKKWNDTLAKQSERQIKKLARYDDKEGITYTLNKTGEEKIDQISASIFYDFTKVKLNNLPSSNPLKDFLDLDWTSEELIKKFEKEDYLCEYIKQN